MEKILKNNYLILILLVAAFLRLYKLNIIPPHLTSDEASLGYNAYSILKTGKDEYGSVLPIIFKSFGDWKPGFYVYLTVPFVAFFGLNEWSVRLPSALTGVVAVWLVYKIILHLFPKKNYSFLTRNLSMATIVAFTLAISPWHIHFSRGAWEVNVALTLTLAGTYFFLKTIIQKPKFLIYSSIFFSLTFITYQGAKLSTAIVVLLLLAIYWKKVIKIVKLDTKNSLVAAVVGVIILSPIVISMFQGKAGRLEVFSVFSYPRKEVDVNQILDQGGETFGSIKYNLYHSEGMNFTRAIMGRWFNHFSTRFLIFEGDWPNPRHSPPNHGMLLLWELVLFPVGLFAFFKSKVTKGKLFVLAWLVFAPLPSILSRDSVHAVRSYNLVIPITIVSAFGLMVIFEWIKGRKKSTQLITYSLLLTALFVGSATYYLDSYFTHLPKHSAKDWSYGNKQIVETVLPIKDKYNSIKIQQSFAQPYIYYLYYTSYDPANYQQQAHLVESEYAFDVGYVERIDNIEFAHIDWPRNRQDKGTLVVADNIRIPPDELEKDGVQLIKEIKYPDGNTAFYVVEVI